MEELMETKSDGRTGACGWCGENLEEGQPHVCKRGEGLMHAGCWVEKGENSEELEVDLGLLFG